MKKFKVFNKSWSQKNTNEWVIKKNQVRIPVKKGLNRNKPKKSVSSSKKALQQPYASIHDSS